LTVTPKKNRLLAEAVRTKQIPEANSTQKTRPVLARVKAWIVTLAVWGIIPANLAQWLLSGRLRHE
jgi:hypothetical protein